MATPTVTASTPSDEGGWFDWAYKGVDHTFPGNGGPECRDFLGLSQRCWESVAASIVGLVALLYAYPRLTLPVPCPTGHTRGETLGKRILLLLMCLTFGIELGFKFSTRQMIWIGNPCHLATMIQIFILAAPPSRIVTAAFRLHMHMLTGAPIAILFPVINTRLLPFETGVYFVQHILMLIIPFYLMKQGDPYIPEKLLDFKWSLMSFGFLYIYHFLPLQYLAYMSQVNLNNMLCPAVSDPFHGKYYRLFAICHQIILIPTLGKIFVIIAKSFDLLPFNNLPDAPVSEVFCCKITFVQSPSCAATPPPCKSSNSNESLSICCNQQVSCQTCGSSVRSAEKNEEGCIKSVATETCCSSVRFAEKNEEECIKHVAAETLHTNSNMTFLDTASCDSCKQGTTEKNNCEQFFVTKTLGNGKVISPGKEQQVLNSSSCCPGKQTKSGKISNSDESTSLSLLTTDDCCNLQESCQTCGSSVRGAEKNEEGCIKDVAAETCGSSVRFAEKKEGGCIENVAAETLHTNSNLTSLATSSCDSCTQGTSGKSNCEQSFVTRTIVNGKVIRPGKEQPVLNRSSRCPGKPSKTDKAVASSSTPAYHRKQWGDFEGDGGPMSLDDLEEMNRNGHLKAH